MSGKVGSVIHAIVTTVLFIFTILLGLFSFATYAELSSVRSAALDLAKELDATNEKFNELHQNLYATRNSLNNQGTHDLSISDVYYLKYFKKETDK